MGRDVVYADALADLESDITKRVISGDDEGLNDEKLLRRWELYRKGKDLAYVPSRTLEILHRDERLVRGVMGPVGSGKTTGIVADMNMRHFHQRVCRDGIVRDRFSLVRGTLALLNATLVDTWVRMFPRTKTYGSKYGVCGSLTQVRNGVTHIIYLRGFGLDKQGALGNLLSNNFSGSVINEAVTVSEAAKDGTAGRNGRYPDLMDAPSGFQNMPGAWIDRDGYPRWFINHGQSMDTNAASEDSWWYKKSRDGGADPEHEVYFEQPPAAFREWNDEQEKWIYELNMGQRPGVPPAENIEHIPEHWDYYRNIIGNAGEAHIRRYVCSEYSKTEVGNAVFSDFSERWHVANSGVPWPAPGTRLVGGMDFGQDRCTVIGYHSAEGRLMVCAEAADKTGSVEEFGNNVLRPLLAQHGFSPNDITIFCDPAGLNRGEHSSIGGILGMRMCGFDAMPPKNLPNNDVLVRLESVRHFLGRIVGAKGAVQLDPGLVHLIRSVGGGYVWKQRRVGVEKMDTDEPAKNAHSHIADAFQYLCCGVRYGGDEAKVVDMVVVGANQNGPVYGSQSQRAGYLEDSALC